MKFEAFYNVKTSFDFVNTLRNYVARDYNDLSFLYFPALSDKPMF